MKKIKIRKNLFRFTIYCIILLMLLFFVSKFFLKNNLKESEGVITSKIDLKDELSIINVEYPRFKDNKIDKLISDYIYDYVRRFKLDNNVKKTLKITHNEYYYKNYVNIVFNIENSLDDKKYKNVIIDLNTKSIAYISNLFEKDFIEKSIIETVYYKYSSDIFDKIKLSNINNHTYIIDDDKIVIYFYDIIIDNLNYYPSITINLNKNVSGEETKYIYDKFIAFTFDDGPSKYTEDLLKTLELNNSTATFFMLGNRMKYNKDVVKKVFDSKNEIGSHTYSHKYLTKISKKDALNEINSSQVIYKEITGSSFKYVRPPYGSYNDYIESLGYPLILWNIDPKDWLYRDSVKVYNNIIKKACDGCIVLLHDIHKETIEAVKKVIPSLNALGYNVVSISDLAKVKNYSIKNKEVVRKIK